MRALVFDQDWHFVEDYPSPLLRPAEALIRVRLAGICNTDLELAKGYMQFHGVAGHEFVGVVEAAPDAKEWEGRRVVGDINAACGVCPTCRAGHPSHCPHRTTLGIAGRDGAFAEYLTLPIRNLYAVPTDLPDEIAVFTEPLAAACEILEQIHIRPTTRVLVLGDGKLGLLCAQVLALTGCDLTLLGHHAEKLEIIGRRGIATQLLSRGMREETTALKGTADVVVEATGNPEGYRLARELVRPRGTLVLKSTYHGSTETNLSAVVVAEITVMGSRCGPFAPALRLLARGLVDVTGLIQARYPFTAIVAALHAAAQPGALKVLVNM